jgi:hypothetical protein
MEEAVPGILRRIAEISPPEAEPIYNPIRRERESTGLIENVSGSSIAIAIVPVRPGIEPKIIPTNTPIPIMSNEIGFSIAAKPIENIYLPSPLT